MPFWYDFGNFTPPAPTTWPLQHWPTTNREAGGEGRRYRAFRYIISENWPDFQQFQKAGFNWPEAYAAAQTEEWLAKVDLTGLSLRTYDSIEATFTEVAHADPSLHVGLQDLGWTIGHDLSLACEAFNDPDVYYPGVDEGIDPVPDEHVEKVIWALQRELNRELRYLPGSNGSGEKRPAVPLSKLPWRIQRAIAERRRLRYKEWGIGQAEFENNRWNLWAMPEDAAWTPPW